MDTLKKAYKVFRWLMLLSTAIGLFLLIKTPPRLSAQPQPAPAVVAENAKSFDGKLASLEEAHQRGDSDTEVRFTADEVSAAVATDAPPTVTPAVAADPGAGNSGGLRPEQVPVQNTQVVFEGDEVRCQFAAQVYGKQMFVTMSGRLGSADGYVTFQPTSFHIGAMPVPISLVQAALDKKLAEPENREKLKLPDFVKDLRIENGELVLVEK